MDNELNIGCWPVYPRLNQLQSGTLVRKIKPRLMDVLMYMAAQPGEVLSVEELVAGASGRSDPSLSRSCCFRARNSSSC